MESRFPAAEHLSDVTMVTEQVVHKWACSYSQASIVLLGGGPPCQGVSGLNSDRKGALKDTRSNLYTHVPRIRDLLKRAFPWARVATLMESVSSMDTSDLQLMSAGYGSAPFLVDAADFSLCRRPRFYWIDWEVLPQEGVTCTAISREGRDYTQVETRVELDDSEYLTPGWSKVSSNRFPTFTTSRCSDKPGRRPAGVHHCAKEELTRWQSDRHQFPPYQYVTSNCLKDGKGNLRLPNVQEREAILGFPVGYTVQCHSKQSHGSAEHLACRLTLLGNSWSVPVIIWLLGHLGTALGIHSSVKPQEAVQRCAPGAGETLAMFLQRPRLKQVKQTMACGSSPCTEAGTHG